MAKYNKQHPSKKFKNLGYPEFEEVAKSSRTR